MNNFIFAGGARVLTAPRLDGSEQTQSRAVTFTDHAIAADYRFGASVLLPLLWLPGVLRHAIHLSL
jgi:hypothetical protein